MLNYYKSTTALGGSGDDFGNKLIPTNDGGFIIAGGTNSMDANFKVPDADAGIEDAFIAKYNRFRQWTKTVCGTGAETKKLSVLK